MARDHGGNIDWAIAQYGAGDWIDLSTGINRRPWPIEKVSAQAWHALPTARASRHLTQIAASWFGCDPANILPVNGASAAIQMIPRLFAPGNAAVLTPTYNEHAASLRSANWSVTKVADPHHMAGAKLAVVVNPNNPDGREWSPGTLTELAQKVGHLIVDESFADPRPDLSIASGFPDNAIILRSFGKFWGLAGLRLGFVIAHTDLLAKLAEIAGPWMVNGPALEIAAAAMADTDWADETIGYHSEAGLRLDHLALRAGWQQAGGTHLFRLYSTPAAKAVQAALARNHIWTRQFPYSDTWLRMGVPGNRHEWDRVTAAFNALGRP
ncbi:threonine-phosphate decarboxylase [Paracoccus sp. 11-3]|uniref:threonine-phosphate decarboxylase n=1 Tax=Paracoccus amoyensis TaxID=2760093 RepID=A0A926GBT7_9RHOB|nr:threonine-phosphate decarboxylase CobD [Paracoccus amoyensis]MBC9248118.1 threonine-phosphate decarboxylase [Paracoccus amoyensis]